jgi:hypothetical protein
MKPVEIIVVIKTETANNYYNVPIENFSKVIELIDKTPTHGTLVAKL